VETGFSQRPTAVALESRLVAESAKAGLLEHAHGGRVRRAHVGEDARQRVLDEAGAHRRRHQLRGEAAAPRRRVQEVAHLVAPPVLERVHQEPAPADDLRVFEKAHRPRRKAVCGAQALVRLEMTERLVAREGSGRAEVAHGLGVGEDGEESLEVGRIVRPQEQTGCGDGLHAESVSPPNALPMTRRRKTCSGARE
jgi:hypothetical protein